MYIKEGEEFRIQFIDFNQPFEVALFRLEQARFKLDLNIVLLFSIVYMHIHYICTFILI